MSLSPALPAADLPAREYQHLARAGVRRFLRRYRVPDVMGLDADDLVSEALLALCCAARSWDPARSTFATYAGRAIHNRLLRVCRLQRGSLVGSIQCLSLQSSGDPNDEPLMEAMPDESQVPHEEVCEAAFGRELRCAISELPTRDRSVLHGVLRGIPFTTIAREHGCSRQRIARIHDRALGRLRERLHAWAE